MWLTFFVLCAAILAATEARGGNCRYTRPSKWTVCENGFQNFTRTLRSGSDCKPQIVNKRTCPWNVGGCRYIPGESYSQCDPATDMQTHNWTVFKAPDGVTCPPRVQMITCSAFADKLNANLKRRHEKRQEWLMKKKAARLERIKLRRAKWTAARKERLRKRAEWKRAREERKREWKRKREERWRKRAEWKRAREERKRARLEKVRKRKEMIARRKEARKARSRERGAQRGAKSNLQHKWKNRRG